jgi:hypothetical protein
MIEQEDRVTLKEVARVPEVQKPINDENEDEKRDDLEAAPALDHWLTGRANATIDTPKGMLIFWKILLSNASKPTSAELIHFGKM